MQQNSQCGDNRICHTTLSCPCAFHTSINSQALAQRGPDFSGRSLYGSCSNSKWPQFPPSLWLWLLSGAVYGPPPGAEGSTPLTASPASRGKNLAPVDIRVWTIAYPKRLQCLFPVLWQVSLPLSTLSPGKGWGAHPCVGRILRGPQRLLFSPHRILPSTVTRVNLTSVPGLGHAIRHSTVEESDVQVGLTPLSTPAL